MRKRQWIFDFITGIIFTIFFISISLILVINCRLLYRADVKLLHLVDKTGYSEEVINENYDALIDYCSPFYKGGLQFPSLPSSDSALSHFDEVKVIFTGFYIMALVCGLLLAVIIAIKHKRKAYRYLKTCALTCIILPSIVGLACMLNFNKTFILFHKMVFSNDDWLFDPATDPIILLLPEQFFMHCALAIVLLVLLGSGILYWIYRQKLRRDR